MAICLLMMRSASAKILLLCVIMRAHRSSRRVLMTSHALRGPSHDVSDALFIETNPRGVKNNICKQ